MSADAASGASAPAASAGLHLARYGKDLGDGRIRCEACPRDCELHDGQRGLCFVRQNVGGRLVLTTYGRSSGFAIDPIEKKPLYHFFPGSSVLSFGTAGCNLTCKFCQNWDISKSREMETLSASASPEAIAHAAKVHGCRSVAFTYNDPVVFIEYAMDAADAAREQGIATVAVTAGYVGAEARRDLFARMDAANVDLKAFTEDFYRKICGGSLARVLETLEYIRHETSVWLELTTLLIPGHNDSDSELHALTSWVREHLGAETPLHFSAFHPDYKMLDVPPTPMATLRRARAIAKQEGLAHVYTGNVHDVEGDTTSCTQCGAELVRRDWYSILDYRLDAQGHCPDCGAAPAGWFGPQAESFGRRSLGVVIP